MNRLPSRRLTALLSVLALGASILGPSLPTTLAEDVCIFTDVCSPAMYDQAFQAIKTLKEQGIIKGNPDGSFRPEDGINRAEMMALLYRARPAQVAYDKAYTFPDNPSSAWYAPYLSAAKRSGFVQGYPDGTFKPGQTVKAEEAAKMALAFYGIPQPIISKGYTAGANGSYGYDPAAWYTPYVKNALDNQLVNSLFPGDNMTRMDAAILLASTRQHEAALKAPVSYLGAWNKDGSSLLSDASGNVNIFLYFSRPLDLASAQKLIEVRGANNRLIKPNAFVPYTWEFGKDALPLASNYPFKPHELKLELSGIADKEQLTVTVKQGIADIYGGTLAQGTTLRYGTTRNPIYLALGGRSYLRSSDKHTAQLKMEGEGANNATVTGYLCRVSTDTMIQKSTYNWEQDVASKIMNVEYLPLAKQLSPQDALKPYCHDIKSADLTGRSKDGQTADIDLDETFKMSLTPGIYFLGMTSTEAKNTFGGSAGMVHKLLYVSDTALTLKYTNSTPMKGLVWATSMKDNTPMANQSIKIYTVSGYERQDRIAGDWKQVATGRTDSNGIYRFTMPEELPYSDRLLAIADGDGHMGLVGSNWDDGLEPYNYGLSMSWGGMYGDVKENRLFVHTDRKIYRPGHEVGIRGVVRKKALDGYTLPGNASLTAAVYDAQNKLVTSFPATLTEMGTFSGSFTLPSTATLGQYNISINDATPSQNFTWDAPIHATFMVEEYRRPEFRVTMNDTKDDYMNGETLTATGKAEYYFGLPLSNGDYTWELTRDTLYFQPQGEEWFSFADGAYCYYYCDGSSGVIATGDGKMDAQGNFSIQTPLDLGDTSTGGLYTLSVEATDANGRVVRAEHVVRAHKANAYVGVRSKQYMVEEGKQLSFDVATLTPQGTTLASKSVRLDLVREDWTSYGKADVSGDTVNYNDATQTIVASQTLTTDANGRAVATFGAQTPGQYFVRATVTDEKGNTNTAREYSYVYSKNADYISWPSEDAYKIQLLLDKPAYKPGEEAKLIIQSPYPKATALLTFERGDVLETMKVDLTNNSAPITIPVKTAYLPNVYISAVVMPLGESQGLKLGYTTMMVDPASKELTVTLTSDKKVYGPGETVTVDILTATKDGRGSSGEVSLAVVDESIIALAGGVDRDIMRAFYSMEHLGVWTAHSLTHYVEQGLLRSVGGGGKGGPSGLPILRGLLKDTAYWNPSIKTDAAGKARVSFVLPDNLTRWEMLSIGVDKESRVGSGSAEIDTRQDLLIQPVLPRFVREGDQLTVTYTVFNLADTPETVQFTLTSQDMTLSDATRTLQVPAKGGSTVTWNTIVPKDKTSITLLAEAKGRVLQDRYTSTLPVLSPDTVDITSSSGYTTAKTASAEVSVPPMTPIVNEKSEVTVRVSPGLIGSLLPSLEYLLRYPYGCVEQTTSVLVGNLMLKDFMQNSKLSVPGVDTKEIDDNVTAALSRIYARQSQGGGFSLWGDEETVDPYLSSYVLEGLQRAMETGYAVDTNVMKKLRSYLEGQLKGGKITDQDTRASALAALRKAGTTGLDGIADTLFKNRTNLTWRSRAALVRYYVQDTTTLGKERVATLTSEIRAKLVTDGNRMSLDEAHGGNYLFYYDKVAANAAALEALATANPKDSVIPGMVAYLLSQREDGYWASTHENVQILRGLNLVVKATPPVTTPVNVAVTIGNTSHKLTFAEGSLSAEQTVTVPYTQLAGPTTKVTLSSDTQNTLYYDASLRYVRTDQSQKRSTTSYQMDRQLLKRVDGNYVPFTGNLKVGESVFIRLRLLGTGSWEGRHIAVEDTLPAGLELLNPAINTEKGRMETEEGWMDFYELHDDRSMFYLRDAHDFSVIVEARAIAPGTFTYPAAQAYEMYRPEKYARTAPTVLSIVR